MRAAAGLLALGIVHPEAWRSAVTVEVEIGIPLGPLYLKVVKVNLGELWRRLRERPSPSPLLLGLPAHYVARDDLLAQIRQAVTAPNGPDGPVVARVGPGGAGKTTLVQATVRDPDVRKRFPEEPLSARLGPDARGESAAEPHLAAWLRELGGDPAVGSTLEEKAEQMRRLLARGRPRLLLVDDVWDAEAARLLVAARGPCPVLLTTRSPGAIDQIDPGLDGSRWEAWRRRRPGDWWKRSWGGR